MSLITVLVQPLLPMIEAACIPQGFPSVQANGGKFDLNAKERLMSHLNAQQRELVAIGASLASNCIPCIKFHVRKGREAGLTRADIRDALEVAEAVRQVPAQAVRDAATAALGSDGMGAPKAKENPGCGGSDDAAGSKGSAGSPCCGSGAGP